MIKVERVWYTHTRSSTVHNFNVGCKAYGQKYALCLEVKPFLAEAAFYTLFEPLHSFINFLFLFC